MRMATSWIRAAAIAVLALASAEGVALAQQPKPKAPSLPMTTTSMPTALPPASAAPPAPAAAAPGGAAAAPGAPPAAALPEPTTHGEGMRGYHTALIQRRLGWQELKLDDLRARLVEGEGLLRDGRTDEAVSRLSEVVEHPRFDLYADSEDGRAAVWLLSDALSRAGAYEPARAYLRRLIKSLASWQGSATYGRRAVRKLVDIAMESDNLQAGLDDLKDVPATAPEETREEVAYLSGRAHEAAGDPDGALVAYGSVTQASRFWAQATYLQGLILVEKGRYKEGENLFCKVADPNRQANTTPVFADEHYFAVRDLARLALGRVAHEQGRFDDSRYYYYLVPRDSDRLAEALYEAATSRYEKKDYDGARELLDEFNAIQGHHRYEDEAWILDAYIDLAQCKFDAADKKLRGFLDRYEPVRDTGRHIEQDDRAMAALLAAAHEGSDAASAEAGASLNPDALRAIAVLVRLDASYGSVVRRRAILEHEASGLKLAAVAVNDMQRSLATNGGVRAGIEEREDPAQQAADARAALDGVRHQIDDLEAGHAAPDRIAGFRQEETALEARLGQASAAAQAGAAAGGPAGGADLAEMLRADAALAQSLSERVEVARRELGKQEAALAKDALHRVDLRLSRLLRRARLGRIESVLGRKRALEVEIEAINDGILPASAVDSLEAARYLKDSEEYWPFEGDDWPDEFVGSEAAK